VTLRTQRIGEQLRGELARLLHEEVSDPRIGLVTFTRVDVSPDLAQALVFWSPLDPRAERDEQALRATREGLASAAAFLRRRVAQELDLRRSPALDFRYDPSLERGAQTLELLRDVQRGEQEGREDGQET
jgi:ribosome-binding factor A